MSDDCFLRNVVFATDTDENHEGDERKHESGPRVDEELMVGDNNG